MADDMTKGKLNQIKGEAAECGDKVQGTIMARLKEISKNKYG